MQQMVLHRPFEPAPFTRHYEDRQATSARNRRINCSVYFSIDNAVLNE